MNFDYCLHDWNKLTKYPCQSWYLHVLHHPSVSNNLQTCYMILNTDAPVRRNIMITDKWSEKLFIRAPACGILSGLLGSRWTFCPQSWCFRSRKNRRVWQRPSCDGEETESEHLQKLHFFSLWSECTVVSNTCCFPKISSINSPLAQVFLLSLYFFICPLSVITL